MLIYKTLGYALAPIFGNALIKLLKTPIDKNNKLNSSKSTT